MAVAFVCVACAAPVGETFVEFEDHRRVAHQRRPVTFTTRMVDDGRPELYLAHCSRCAAEIRTTVPLADPVPVCRSCAEISRAGLEFHPPIADAALVNPTRSDPKETNMNVTIKLTALTADQAGAARDLGFEATKSTATFVGDPNEILARIHQASADLKAAKKAAGKKVGNAPHIDNLARKFEMAVVNTQIPSETPGDENAPPENTDGAPIPVALPAVTKGDRIPAGKLTFTCRACGLGLPVKKFPTVSGPDDRATICRPCRDGAKGTRPARGAAKGAAKVSTQKGLDPATAPFGIGGSSQAEVDRAFKAAWKAAEVDGQVAADIQDQLRAAQHAATLALPRASVAKKVA